MANLVLSVRSGAAHGTDIPRLSEPATVLAFATAFDFELIGDESPDIGDLPVLSNLQRQAGEVAKAYIMAGVKSDVETPQQGILAGNFLEYLPELAIIYDFQIATGARISELTAQIARRVGAMGDEEPGIFASILTVERIQLDLLSLIVGAVSDPNLQFDWRADRIGVLNRVASRFAALMSDDSARSIADMALAAAIAESDPRIAAALKQFAFIILR